MQLNNDERHRCNRRARRGEFWTNTDTGGGLLDPFRLVADADELETVCVRRVPGFFGQGYFWQPSKECTALRASEQGGVRAS